MFQPPLTLNAPVGDYNWYVTPQQGWQCPVCLRVYAPFMPVCSYCPAKTETVTGTQQCVCGSSAQTGLCPVHPEIPVTR